MTLRTADVPRNDKGIWKRALWLVPLIVILGSLSGILSNSAEGEWYRGLEKPSFQPPGWAFGAAWTTLYTMMALALATVLNEPRTAKRDAAVAIFVVQLVLNYAWSFVFFSLEAIEAAKWWILAILVLAAIAAGRFWRIRPLAGALMLPYLLWLIFAYTLNSAIVRLNPGAGSPLFG
ncbi:TspO/MBR family protein [Sphingomicrobium nitratireducens]|uniref:TspO/MBR family protein n=1 Tax=Sphingomicrobium nitratireducens TaxID=2964666 RepID=UPI00223F4CBC|nr:TspO/MBR family protein [Sphingomicrobium nitratireducens]